MTPNVIHATGTDTGHWHLRLADLNFSSVQPGSPPPASDESQPLPLGSLGGMQPVIRTRIVGNTAAHWKSNRDRDYDQKVCKDFEHRVTARAGTTSLGAPPVVPQVQQLKVHASSQVAVEFTSTLAGTAPCAPFLMCIGPALATIPLALWHCRIVANADPAGVRHCQEAHVTPGVHIQPCMRTHVRNWQLQLWFWRRRRGQSAEVQFSGWFEAGARRSPYRKGQALLPLAERNFELFFSNVQRYIPWPGSRFEI